MAWCRWAYSCSKSGRTLASTTSAWLLVRPFKHIANENMYPYRRRYTHTYDVDIHTHSFIGTDTHIKNTHKEKNLSVYFLRKHLRYPNMKWKTVRNSLIVLILFFVENYLQHLFSESFCFNFCLKSLRPRCMVFFSYSENVGDNYVLMETNFIFVNICLSCVIRKTGSVSLN